MQTRKSGRGGTSIPYSSLSSMLLGSVRSFAAILRKVRGMKPGRPHDYYLENAQVARILLEHLERDLDGVCREEDMVNVVQAIAIMCTNSTWAKEARGE